MKLPTRDEVLWLLAQGLLWLVILALAIALLSGFEHLNGNDKWLMIILLHQNY
jgi:hypothetical protein